MVIDICLLMTNTSNVIALKSTETFSPYINKK